jgi:hypothetical protein
MIWVSSLGSSGVKVMSTEPMVEFSPGRGMSSTGSRSGIEPIEGVGELGFRLDRESQGYGLELAGSFII